MAGVRRQTSLDKRLREIEREKARVRERIAEVRDRPDPVPDGPAWRSESPWSREVPPRRKAKADEIPPPMAVGVLEMESPDMPDREVALDFAPGPDGLDVKRVVMPRLQRTDLLRPSLGGHPTASRLMEPEYDRFRSYFGTAGLKRVREARRERGSHRIRAIFMILMVLTLSYILFKMVT